MSEEFVKRGEYMHGQERMHARVDEIAQCSTRIEEAVKHISKDTSDMHRVVYGNGNNGLTTRLSNVWAALKLNRWLISILVVGILGLAFRILGE